MCLDDICWNILPSFYPRVNVETRVRVVRAEKQILRDDHVILKAICFALSHFWAKIKSAYFFLKGFCVVAGVSTNVRNKNAIRDGDTFKISFGKYLECVVKLQLIRLWEYNCVITVNKICKYRNGRGYNSLDPFLLERKENLTSGQYLFRLFFP